MTPWSISFGMSASSLARRRERTCATLQDGRLYQAAKVGVKTGFFVRRLLFRGATALVVAISVVSSVSAQNFPRPEPIVLDELPRPPDVIGNLIESAEVTFEAGPRDPAEEIPTGPRTSAETHYRIGYSYSSRSRWQIDPDRKQVRVTIRFSRIRWEPSHRIWFRRRPTKTGFWSNRLVLHEFDHVRISSDPRMAKRFEEMLHENSVLTQSISEPDVVDREYVDRMIARHVEEVFREISDLIAIRYTELDRVTRHGRDDVPEDSPINRWLDPESDPLP